ncbi:MAG: type II toxin-antitoxin system VapC family toxin [Burkholderiales bacterium]
MSNPLDTCMVAELSQPKSDSGVLTWMAEANVSRLHLSTITVAEMHRGCLRLPVGKRRTSLMQWSATLRQSFAGRVMPIGEAIALRLGEIVVRADQSGRPTSFADGLIAASALELGMTLVTRNITDFEPFGVSLFSPWTHP